MKAIVFTAALLLLPIAVPAATVGGIHIPDQRGELKLSGAGVLRKGLFFKIYVGALYTGNDRDDQNDPIRRIDIHYFHRIPKKHMIDVANKTMEKNIGEIRMEKLREKTDRLHAAFMDGEKGSFASILHRPGLGLTYSYNDEPVITIPCDEFAAAYFSIWLGDEPSSRTMKKAMLGGNPE
ncbi:chalcone isomerase family protein [Pontiella sp.]|uniref:chalcone isomerase family protein n=1 Tax=Pontiella sp. TaxID=2837462 RepID=UPI00356137A2